MDITAISAAAVMFILGATSPGPSLAVILRNTMIGGRVRGLACAVGSWNWFRFLCGKCSIRISCDNGKNPDIFTLMQIIGGLFLLYLGIGMIRSEAKVIVQSEGKREGFFEGFFIAFLNPKIAVFMLAVLSSVLDPSMSSDTKWVIAGMGMTIDTVWYVIVALLLSKSTILVKIENNQRVLNVATGVLMLGLAIWTAYKLSGL